jgi:simple sugar transport system substrate-binding protein
MTSLRIVPALAALALAAAPALAPPLAAQEPLKIGFVYVSPIGSAGWTYQHELARQHLEKTFAGRIKTTYVESVPEGADAERVIRRLAQEGNKLVFTTSFGYMDPTVKVAAAFPNTFFEHATGYKLAKNSGTYIIRFEEGRYLAGLVAGKMSKTGTAGYVAAFPIPEVIRGINAFIIGMREVNPKAKVRVVWVSSWYDPGKEREAAEALIAQGADVVMQHTDSTAPVQAAEAKGVFAIGYHSDMAKFGPKAHLVASTHDWTGYYRSVVEQVMKGQWKSQAFVGGIKEGMVVMAGWGPMVPAEVKKLVADKEAAIKAGKFAPFQGPVKAQDGKVTVPAGRTMAEKDILEMNYYVEGVEGQLPKK